MSDVILSSAARASVIALQNIASLMQVSQKRIATGRRVNVPSDDPAAFFTASALSSRAVALNSVLDNITTAQSTVDAANQGITTIRSLIASAQSVANQALQSASTLVTITGTNGTALTTGTTIATTAGSSTTFKAGDVVTVSDGTTTATYTAANNDTVQTFLDAVNNTANLKVTASLNSSGQIQLTASDTVNVTLGATLGGSGTLSGVLSLNTGTTNFVANSTRQALATQFNSLLTQIDQAAQDADFNGTNLLTGGTLSVNFNETGSSKLTISGTTLTCSGLGIAASTSQFQTDASINTALTNLSNALTTLQSQSSVLGSQTAIVQARSDFTKAMVNTLNEGADTLVAADTNAESATLLALQTRQQIAVTSLSLSQGADSTVLRLFGL
jgi:flagellin